MSVSAALEQVMVEAGIRSAVSRVSDLSGGCIHQVLKVELENGRCIVAKMNHPDRAAMFEQEADGLRRLAKTQTVHVPEVIGIVHQTTVCILLLSWLPPAMTPVDWRRFGEELAMLHNVDVGLRYGLDAHNHLGTTFQPNTWCDDWVEFNARYRLGHQLRLCRNANLVSDREAIRIEHVISRLDQHIPRTPKPALLHGDLWSGNAVQTQNERGEACVALIDPAVSIGDGWADIAMMQLFGGFPSACYQAYRANVNDHDMLKSRIAVYQLYHVMNHMTIFGRGYVPQAMDIVAQLGG